MQITHLPGRGLVAAVVSSIGVRHDDAHALVSDGLYLDLRRALRNFADDPTMRYRIGLDARVHAHDLATSRRPRRCAGRAGGGSSGHHCAG